MRIKSEPYHGLHPVEPQLMLNPSQLSTHQPASHSDPLALVAPSLGMLPLSSSFVILQAPGQAFVDHPLGNNPSYSPPFMPWVLQSMAWTLKYLLVSSN